MKYILVTGGVISGLGKGVIASSIGALLKECGLHVTSIKIDPYLNIDAGTFSPLEHGEVFVLDDGAEVDLDLGNYERFMDITLHGKNNITTGKIYKKVIEAERNGDYLGKTVQVIPHITDAIIDWVTEVAAIPVDGQVTPDVCIIELGGTIGDIESSPFVEAFRQFQQRQCAEDFCCIHVSLVPQPNNTKEQKTKPTQASVRELRSLGLYPSLIMARCPSPIEESVRRKISLFCHVPPQQVISVPDENECIYRVPISLASQGVTTFLMQLFKFDRSLVNLPVDVVAKPFIVLSKRARNHTEEVKIALVGKYVELEDAYLSVTKALKHAALSCGFREVVQFVEAEDLQPMAERKTPEKYHAAMQKLCSSDGLLVPGGFGHRGIEGKVAAVEFARKHKKPLLGICLGMQCAVIEVARNVLGLKNANSSEFERDLSHPVVIDMPEHHPGPMGATMRCGSRCTVFNEHPSVLRLLYRNEKKVNERHRHRYEVNPDYVGRLEEAGLHFVGRDEESGKRMEIVELGARHNHPYFVGVQYHPEYLSRPNQPSPPYLGLILAAKGRLDLVLKRLRADLPLYGDEHQVLYNMDELNGSEEPPKKLIRLGSAVAAANAVGDQSPVSLPSSPESALVNT